MIGRHALGSPTCRRRGALAGASRTLVIAAVALAAAWGAAFADPPAFKPSDVPTLHTTWGGPFGDPRAHLQQIERCADSTSVDTLYLSFETGNRAIRLVGLSGVLLFEPDPRDTLGTFWKFERTGPNAGGLTVDLDRLVGDTYESPWSTLVEGHVGYSHLGGRGRLDVSANVSRDLPKTLPPHQVFAFARIGIHHARQGLTGCRAPMTVRWASAILSTYERARAWAGSSPPARWNAGRGAVRRRVQGVVEAWTPLIAPPSQVSLPPFVPPASRDSSGARAR